MQATKKLASNPDRQVFVSLFLLTNTEHRTEPQYKAIASFLPSSVVARLEEMVQTGCCEDLTFLDALGEVKSVERVKVAFRTWFKTKVKTTKAKPEKSKKNKS